MPENLPQVCPWYRVLKGETNSNNNIELEKDEIGCLAEDLSKQGVERVAGLQQSGKHERGRNCQPKGTIRLGKLPAYDKNKKRTLEVSLDCNSTQ